MESHTAKETNKLTCHSVDQSHKHNIEHKKLNVIVHSGMIPFT